jgi:hypothetical protein
LNNVNNEASYDHLAPMERWRMETQQQSPWNGVAAVNAVKKERYGEFGLSPEDGGHLRLIDSRQFQENGVGVWWIPEDDPLALCEILYFLILCWWKC